MTDQPDLSTLPKRMRYAANVMDEAKKRLDAELGRGEEGFGSEWHSHALRTRARIWDDQDRKAADREPLVQQLAHILHEAHVRGDYEDHARYLIESGWRKGDPA